jgi:hypothetical protein
MLSQILQHIVQILCVLLARLRLLLEPGHLRQQHGCLEFGQPQVIAGREVGKFVVANPDEDEIKEIYLVRSVLEGLATLIWGGEYKTYHGVLQR